jgi:hypothetical protein
MALPPPPPSPSPPGAAPAALPPVVSAAEVAAAAAGRSGGGPLAAATAVVSSSAAAGGSKKRRPQLAERYRIVAACFLATFVAYVERVGFSIAFTEIAKGGGGGEALKGAVLSAFYWGYGVSQVGGLYMYACVGRERARLRNRARRQWGGPRSGQDRGTRRCALLPPAPLPPRASRQRSRRGVPPPAAPTAAAAAAKTSPRQIPGGWAAQKYGGRAMLSLSFALWSLASLLTPGSAERGTAGIVGARVCVGVAQGFLIPAVHTVLSQVRRTPRRPVRDGRRAAVWGARPRRPPAGAGERPAALSGPHPAAPSLAPTNAPDGPCRRLGPLRAPSPVDTAPRARARRVPDHLW